MKLLRNNIFTLKLLFVAVVFLLAFAAPVFAQKGFDSGLALPKIDLDFDQLEREPVPMGLQLMLYLTMLTVIPYVFVCCTAFIRVSIILSFLKSNIGLNHGVPKQVWTGLGLMVTLFIMAPVFTEIERNVLTPYMYKQISYEQFMTKLKVPAMSFMQKNTRVSDLKLFVLLSKPKNPEKSLKNPPFFVLLAAFMLSEMKTGFYIGFIIYLPFLCIDMIVAASLMSMGMFMLSPMGFSLPCKMLCFCMIDGFELLIEGLARSYRY